MIITDKVICKRSIVKCSIDTVWWKWTTHEGLLTFFGKDNTMELRIGGPFEIYFSADPPPGERGSEGCTVISYLPKKMLSFSWNAPPLFPAIRNGEHRTWVVVTFKPFNKHQTEVEISHLGWPHGERWDEVYDYFDKAWDVVMQWLKTSCGNQ